jgi:hypothetical protein
MLKRLSYKSKLSLACAVSACRFAVSACCFAVSACCCAIRVCREAKYNVIKAAVTEAMIVATGPAKSLRTWYIRDAPRHSRRFLVLSSPDHGFSYQLARSPVPAKTCRPSQRPYSSQLRPGSEMKAHRPSTFRKRMHHEWCKLAQLFLLRIYREPEIIITSAVCIIFPSFQFIVFA